MILNPIDHYKHIILNPIDHYQLKLHPSDNRFIAIQQSLINIVIDDIEPLTQAEKPIILSTYNIDACAVAILNPNDNENPINGHIPYYFREYPFSLIRSGTCIDSVDQPEHHNVVTFDSRATNLNYKIGHQLFNQDGKPTKFLVEVMNRLLTLNEKIDHTTATVQAISSCHALSYVSIMYSGQTYSVFSIDQDKLEQGISGFDTDIQDSAKKLAKAVNETIERYEYEGI